MLNETARQVPSEHIPQHVLREKGRGFYLMSELRENKPLNKHVCLKRQDTGTKINTHQHAARLKPGINACAETIMSPTSQAVLVLTLNMHSGTSRTLRSTFTATDLHRSPRAFAASHPAGGPAPETPLLSPQPRGLYALESCLRFCLSISLSAGLHKK